MVTAVKSRVVAAVVNPLCDERQKIRVDEHLATGDTVVQILHSDYRWRKLRNKHVQDEPFCQMCGIRRKLEAHHIIPWHLDVLLRFDQNNLITLCRECHFRFGHFLNWKDMNPEIRELCQQAKILNLKIGEIGL
jgi:5-methylcytosine-specific restriction endonuclease McrA